MGETFSKCDDELGERPSGTGDLSNVNVEQGGSSSQQPSNSDRQLISSSYLERDLQSYYNECNICGLNFTSRHKLRRHALLHTSNKPFSCNKCENAFENFVDLQIHMRSHPTVEHPFVCNFCDKSFDYELNFYSHMKEHMGVYVHTCEICCKNFTQKSFFLCHMWSHTEGELHKCTYCDKMFIMRSDLRLHVMAHSFDNNLKNTTNSQVIAS